MNSESSGGNREILRHLAEERIDRQADAPSSPGDPESARLSREVELLRVELEMQNEELRRALVELENHARCFAELYDFAPLGYFSLGADGRIEQLNLLAAQMLGSDRHSLVGRSFGDFVSDGEQAAFARFIARIHAGEIVEPCEVTALRAGLPPVVVRLKGVLASDGSICRLAAMDITERKHAEEALRISEEKFRSIVQHSPLGMCLFRLSGEGRLILVDANPAAEEETGIGIRRLVGKPVDQAFPEIADTPIPEALRQVATGESGSQSFMYRHHDEQNPRAFSVHLFQANAGSVATAFMDISDRIRIEESLKQAQDDLERQVQSRTAQLEERTRQLRALASALTLAEDRERSRIAGVIHDHLQQMLVAALLNLEMFKSSRAVDGDAADLGRIENILREGIEVTRSLTAELSPAVLHQCGLPAALKWLRCWCGEKFGLQLEVTVDEEADPDVEVATILFLSVRELLFNIVKHAGVKSASVCMWRTQGGRMIRIEVRDEGAGFDPEVVRAREGTTGGFGLFNVRERLDLLGGGMEAVSAPGLGSCFTLWAPCHVSRETGEKRTVGDDANGAEEGLAAAAETAFRAPLERQMQAIRVVLADDHPTVRETLVLMFHSEPDFEVVGLAADGLEVLQLVRDLMPDCVVMDLSMPRMDGHKATAAIRRLFPDVKVVGISSDADENRREALMRAGALELIPKNRSITQLPALLRQYCGQA